MNDLKFDFDDVLITPDVITNIDSRYAEINIYYADFFLPLFTAPMDTVVDQENYVEFLKNKIKPVLPRTVKTKTIFPVFNSFGLAEFEKHFLSKERPYTISPHYILIDVANGHMARILSSIKKMKEIYEGEYGNRVIIMAGNIANPKTYELYCESGVVDYARIGIGNGNGCLTTQQTGVGYPMGSLISECHQIKKQYSSPTKIIADGGMKQYSDIIKALALGADYVMIGSIFNKALESASDTYFWKFKLNKKWREKFHEAGLPLHKEFRGMSTKKAQAALGNTKFKTSEGVVRKQYVEYTLSQWVENFESYLRTAMSYTDAKTLYDFVGCVDYTRITERSFNRFNK